VMGGFEATVVGRGAEAVELVRQREFEAVLVDHRMPAMSGTEVYERVVEIRPGMAHRFVMMSGDTETPELREFATARSVALLAKPFDVRTVVRLVGDVVDQARAGDPSRG
jgi:CheY-like chemotaxis protein